MADLDDQDSRTEEPTERKIQEALDKGNVPFAREAVTLGSLMALLLVLKIMVPWLVAESTKLLAALLGSAGSIRLETREDAVTGLITVTGAIAAIMLPVLAVLSAGAVFAALLQNVPRAASDRVQPKLSRISLLAGWQRIFGLRGLAEFAKTLVKLAAILVVTGIILLAEARGVVGALLSEPALLPARLLSVMIALTAALCAVALALAAFDIAWSRFQWRKSLRMTKQELKEEFRQSEGDPHLKAKARGAARRRATRGMMAKLPTATMVITNPTHFAVALRYVRSEGGVPVVVAKGLDHVALRIRALAAGHEIPVVENKPLARSLYDSVDVDEAIPPELYRAVAEIIHFLTLRGSYASAPARH